MQDTSSPKYNYSIYNNIIKDNIGQPILYNTFTHALVKIPNIELPDINTISDNRIISFMLKNGFIVDSNVDEAKRATDIMKIRLASDENFYLMINPTLQCNCRCWYCIENHPSGSIDDDTVMRIKDLTLKVLSSDVKSLSVSFFGGEPFLQFNHFIKPFMEWCTDACRKFNKPLHYIFTTNGLLLTDEIINYLKLYPNSNFQITLDSGRVCHNNTRVLKGGDSYGKVIDTIKKLAQNHINVIVRLNLTHENIHMAEEVCDDFSSLSEDIKKHLRLSCQQVWQDVKKGSLSPLFYKIKEKFIENGIMPDTRDLDWINSSCYGDRKNAILVNYNGDLYKCSAIDYDQDPKIGNIAFSEPIELINSDFKKYVSKKVSMKTCNSCRVFPICARGCYKRLMVNPTWECIFKTDKEKDEQILQNIEELAYICSLKEVY